MFKLLTCVERAFALIAVVALLPFLALIAGIIFILSGRAPLVAHRRLGRYGEPFRMLKFRTMWSGARSHPRAARLIEQLCDDAVPDLKAGGDPRVTSRCAAFCRKHSIDELPQFWHVVRGEMSLVGPRPMTELEWAKHYGDSAREILGLRPGISGLWQTRGRNRLTYRQRRRLDIFLARHYCLWLYVRIVAKTIPRVLAGRDAW